MAEALVRLADSYLTGPTPDGTGRARTTALVVVDVAQLAGPEIADAVPAATSRLLWRTAGGRTAPSTARVSAMTCDAAFVPLLTDGDVVVAVGDANDPIPMSVRRAATVRDQGCRMPGCDRPAPFTDLHHVVFRRHGGETSLANLVSMCRFCHNLVHDHGWTLTLHTDGTLIVQRGRYRLISRPRLRPPPDRAASNRATSNRAARTPTARTAGRRRTAASTRRPEPTPDQDGPRSKSG